jgi:tetratricopeptide (TPR) repeat protein
VVLSESLRQRAERAIETMLIDREAGALEAEQILLGTAADVATRSIAQRVMASIKKHRGNISEAIYHADESVQAASSTDEPELLGYALLSRMGALISDGRAEDAIEDSMRAEGLLPEAHLVRLLIQRGTALGLGLGRVNEAIATYDQVEQEYENLEPIVEAVLTMNRGTQLTARGDHTRALADFGRARVRYRELGNTESECDVLLHQARAAARTGDFPTVFELHAEVQQRNLLAGSDHRTYNDLASALLTVGLSAEAEAMSLKALDAVGSELTAPGCDAALSVAQVRGELGDVDSAIQLCERVESWARARHLEGLVLTSRLVKNHAVSRVTSPNLGTLNQLIELAIDLESVGRAGDAADLRVEAATIALSLYEESRVIEILDPVPLPKPAGQVDELTAARSRHAQALRLIAEGDSGKALQQLTLGLDALDRMRGVIAAMEIRATASDRAPELARMGVELVATKSRPRSLMRWAERQRATAMRLTAPVTLGYESVGERRLARQRFAARRRSGPADVLSELDGRTLIEFVDIAGTLHALVAVGERISHRAEVGNMSEIAALLDRLLFGLRRMIRSPDDGPASSAPMVQAAAAALSAVLIDPLLEWRRELVIIPTGRLHDVPWGALPGLERRPFTVAPSADSWLRAEASHKRMDDVAAMAGPGLRFALKEIAEVGRIHGCAPAAEPSGVASALAQFEASDLVHVAAHGTIRNDNAIFSSLELADGPLFVHQLENVRHMPSVIVLSSCSVGAVELLRGDEVLGFPAALLARGVRSLVASLLPVEDKAAGDLMVVLHRHLKAGLGPSFALAEARREVGMISPRHSAAASSFLCFGSG